ncbi:MAG TPA: guanylate kinase [Candidatus Binataceae bacterium]|nr:guanylate kinase [Candidatus Binataceae bacterium]
MRVSPDRRGIIFVLSAPSGAGKTTISRAALKEIPGLELSISLTTRAPRENEVDGVDYHFVTDAEFSRIRDRGELAEWARVFDASYGTPRGPLDAAVEAGRDMLLDIDIHGAESLRKSRPADSVTIFVVPPSYEELKARLRNRGTETKEVIERRLTRALDEVRAWPDYDYLIINDDVRKSIDRLRSVVEAERLRVKRLRDGFVPWKS